MAAIDPGYAAWLKAEAVTLTGATADAARWGGRGVTAGAPIAPFATPAGGAAELARRQAFFGQPLVRDRLVVPGERRDLIGRCVRTGGAAGRGDLVFVIGVAERDDATTVLTVLRRLA